MEQALIGRARRLLGWVRGILARFWRSVTRAAVVTGAGGVMVARGLSDIYPPLWWIAAGVTLIGIGLFVIDTGDGS